MASSVSTSLDNLGRVLSVTDARWHNESLYYMVTRVDPTVQTNKSSRWEHASVLHRSPEDAIKALEFYESIMKFEYSISTAMAAPAAQQSAFD
eukprot:ANDGO_08522.mRNA.1 hypothetical protein